MKIATLLEPDVENLRLAIQTLDPFADAFEVRLDALRHPVEPETIRRLTRKPLIATCRRETEGGSWRGDEKARLQWLEAAAQAGFQYVDVEDATRIRVPEARLVRSHHSDRNLTADEAFRQGMSLGANHALAKVVGRVRDFMDVLDLLEAARRMRDEGTVGTVLGLGDFPRAFAALCGNEFTYGGGRTSLPGQPFLKDVAAALRRWGDPKAGHDLYAVVGHPIAHSLSPRLHNAAFRALALDAAMGALDVRTESELGFLFGRGPALRLRGASVTTPLKLAAWRRVDRTTPEARRAKSVNCVRWEGGKVVGHNTDGIGARRVLERLLGQKAAGAKVIVVGTGGAARGILSQPGPYELLVAGRDRDRLRALESNFGVASVPLERVHHRFYETQALVNATSVLEPLALDGFKGALFDLHYAEGPTPWERHAQSARLPFAGGRALLLEQAIPAFEFWTGTPAPRAAMESAAEAA